MTLKVSQTASQKVAALYGFYFKLLLEFSPNFPHLWTWKCNEINPFLSCIALGQHFITATGGNIEYKAISISMLLDAFFVCWFCFGGVLFVCLLRGSNLIFKISKQVCD